MYSLCNICQGANETYTDIGRVTALGLKRACTLESPSLLERRKGKMLPYAQHWTFRVLTSMVSGTLSVIDLSSGKTIWRRAVL